MDSSESERFERAVLPHLRAAYNLARWLSRRDEDAQDVVQEACVRALRFFGGFRGEDGKGWLLAIVRNTFYSAYERRKAAGEGLASSRDEEPPEIADEAPGPEALLMQESSRRALHAALEALPVEFREAIVLREIEGLSYKEMAEVTGVPIGTVMSRLARGREKLRRAVQAPSQGGPA